MENVNLNFETNDITASQSQTDFRRQLKCVLFKCVTHIQTFPDLELLGVSSNCSTNINKVIQL